MPVGNTREDGDGVATTAAGGSGGGGTLVASCASDEANASRVIAILVSGRPAEMDPDPDPDPDPSWLLPSELLAAALGRNGSGEDASRPAESLTGAAAPALLLATWPRKEPPLPRKDPTPPTPPDPVVPLLLPPLPRLRKEPPGVRLRRLPLPMWLEKSGSSALAAMAASRSASEGTLRVRVMIAARVRSSMRDCETGRTGRVIIGMTCSPLEWGKCTSTKAKPRGEG